MKHKVLEINEKDLHLVCIKDENAKINPYRLYKVWYDNGHHRKQIVRYEDFISIMYHVGQIVGIVKA